MKREWIKIDDGFDLLCIMSDMVSEFLEDMRERKGYTRPVDQEDIDSGWDLNPETSFLYTDFAIEMKERYESRLKAVFIKNFPDEEDEFELQIAGYYEM